MSEKYVADNNTHIVLNAMNDCSIGVRCLIGYCRYGYRRPCPAVPADAVNLQRVLSGAPDLTNTYLDG